MFLDFRRVDSSAKLETDVAIIGAGAAGITIARELIKSGISVCLLESGGFDYEFNTQSLYKGECIGLPYYPLENTRLRFFGGATNHWTGLCAPLSEIDFEARPWVPYSGWPISRADLDRYYERPNRFLISAHSFMMSGFGSFLALHRCSSIPTRFAPLSGNSAIPSQDWAKSIKTRFRKQTTSGSC